MSQAALDEAVTSLDEAEDHLSRFTDALPTDDQPRVAKDATDALEDLQELQRRLRDLRKATRENLDEAQHYYQEA